MAAKLVRCAKLGQELPGIDDATPAGARALRMCRLLGGAELARRVQETISAQAWSQWADHMRMVINEYRLDATSDEANPILRQHLEDFFFGRPRAIPNFIPPDAPKGE